MSSRSRSRSRSRGSVTSVPSVRSIKSSNSNPMEQNELELYEFGRDATLGFMNAINSSSSDEAFTIVTHLNEMKLAAMHMSPSEIQHKFQAINSKILELSSRQEKQTLIVMSSIVLESIQKFRKEHHKMDMLQEKIRLENIKSNKPIKEAIAPLITGAGAMALAGVPSYGLYRTIANGLSVGDKLARVISRTDPGAYCDSEHSRPLCGVLSFFGDTTESFTDFLRDLNSNGFIAFFCILFIMVFIAFKAKRVSALGLELRFSSRKVKKSRRLSKKSKMKRKSRK